MFISNSLNVTKGCYKLQKYILYSFVVIIDSVHYCDVIMGTVASQITSLTIVYSTVYSGENKANSKAPRHWLLCGKFTGDRRIPRTNGHLMTSSCYMLTFFSFCYWLFEAHWKCFPDQSGKGTYMIQEMVSFNCSALWLAPFMSV